jgi:hypothetical protein
LHRPPCHGYLTLSAQEGNPPMADQVQDSRIFTTVAAVLMVCLISYGVLSLLGVIR